MLRDLKLDRVTYANINLWATLLGAAICLPIGRMFDRVGLRGATFTLIALLSVVVWTMSQLAGGAILLFLLILATRALGQSALSVASITAVGKSFDRRVGMAMGIYSVLLSLFFAAAFIAVGNAVRVSGWRTAWAQIALGLILFAAPIVLLLRERIPHPASDPAGARAVDDGLSLAAALRTPAFWVFAGATSLFGLVSSGLGLFNEAVLAARGVNQQTSGSSPC
jgi:MFS family permease